MKENDIQMIRQVIHACRRHEKAVLGQPELLEDVANGLAISATKLEIILERNTCTKAQGNRLLVLLKEEVRKAEKELKAKFVQVKKMPAMLTLADINEVVAMKLALVEACSEAMKADKEKRDPVVAVREWLYEPAEMGWTRTQVIGYQGRPIQNVLLDLDRHNGKVQARKIVRDLLIIVMGVGG